MHKSRASSTRRNKKNTPRRPKIKNTTRKIVMVGPNGRASVNGNGQSVARSSGRSRSRGSSRSRTRKLKVNKVGYSTRCKNIKSHEFMRKLYSKNLLNRVTENFKKKHMNGDFFLNHHGNVGAVNSGKWTTAMRRQYKLIRKKFGMKRNELRELRNDYKCNMFRTITKNHAHRIIGVLSIPTSSAASNGATSYIPQSYVNWLEMRGARVVPIMYDLPQQVINVLLNQVDGLLLIGGTVEGAVLETSHYRFMSTLKYIVNKITHFNLTGNHFPIFSICLGFELLPMICAGGEITDLNEISDDFVNNRKISFLRKNGPSSIRFTGVSDRDREILVSRPMQDCFTPVDKTAVSRELSTAMLHNKSFVVGAPYMDEYEKFMSVTATADAGGKTYVAAFQFKSLPFYGVQFHPEKVFFEHIHDSVPHGEVAKMLSSKLLDMFMSECGRNYNIHVFGANDDANLFIENYDLLSRENAVRILFPQKTKMFNTSAIGASYYFGRMDGIVSNVAAGPALAKGKSIRSVAEEDTDHVLRDIARAKEGETTFYHSI